MSANRPPADPFPLVAIALMKGVVYAESDPSLWQALLSLHARVREHVGAIGLELMVDEVEGHAYLRQRAGVNGEPELPRLVARRPLGYSVSLLLVLLRKRLAELDASGGETRLILGCDDLVDLMRLFRAEGSNEARSVDRIDADIQKVVELGFLRRLRGQEERFEVRRLLAAFVDAQWLDAFEARLAQYREHAAGRMGDGGEGAR
jgi:hypothetical protein